MKRDNPARPDSPTTHGRPIMMISSLSPRRCARSIGALCAVLGALGFLLPGCASPDSARQSPEGQAGGGQVSVESCGRTVTLKAPARRVLVENSVGLPQLADLGVLDRVVGRVGDADTSVYPAETRAAVEAIPRLAGTPMGSGHTMVSTETLLANDVDLVIGYPQGVDLEKAEAAGIAFYVPQAYCSKEDSAPADVDAIWRENTAVGALIGEEEKASALNDALRAQLEEIRGRAGEGAWRGRRVMGLFLTPGDTGTLWAYGAGSMLEPQLEALGARNVYGSHGRRVLQIGMEDVLAEDPDVIVLLHTTGSEEEIRSTFEQLRGSESLRVSREGRVVVLPYPLVDPPSSLSIEGLRRLAERTEAARG
ncbi:ABC transporter substrate-binding protein [Corynebacterium uropygiale]|uniref:ABC transporter substrate-binding protein n=1 Tax=Corynebacterium uropygiale TaxID=1775911 RepID=A0A9X1QPM1_9CORY|nr:ABC transporter substrate-binding protein [Corynebacterium uropygiale]MCF4005875.1 ABC transporter substrate-binding protein [Corynebacterium uropygiale]